MFPNAKSLRLRFFRGARLLVVALLSMCLPAGSQTARVAPAPVSSAASDARSVGVLPSACFPVESLSVADRELAEEWLLHALDHEALYTIAATLKPASLALSAGRISVSVPTVDEREALLRAARVLTSFHCGDLGATLVSGTVVIDGRRVLHGVFFRRAALRRAIEAHPMVFGAAGIAPMLPAEQALATTELLPPPLRHRAWGQLLGYPDYAVEFFARADQTQRESGKPGGEGIVPRDFYSVPTFTAGRGFFVWAVPKGHEENAVDRAIRLRAEAVLGRYRKLRERFVGEGKPGVVALVRELLCQGELCGVGIDADSALLFVDEHPARLQ